MKLSVERVMDPEASQAAFGRWFCCTVGPDVHFLTWSGDWAGPEASDLYFDNLAQLGETLKHAVDPSSFLRS